ncbi:hypothetical protein HMSSN036_60850 [Paenibacillus macerans]|uniref:Uncharacterized protein n=1 Tax=Paenibacillus macerans TaxID=44252 RepID=A0A6N8F3A8_PAEMA|nr:hypothetical protein [Paenibacillus macerans]MBS5915158.1 hypothetical protein [Paenibacillus macerans]MCY7561430.1 hypothetical protein [Paenibacillus macerans]MEC0138490.1 hypothetical protein [Paenibacillus macerans]MEC0155205.1 hypothetical protein [Paenibacillus macerans]MEC0333243.1 hypothetical protein [Paenibacillus macerans]
MSNGDAFERRSELLKRRIGRMICRENQYGLGRQDALLLQRFIKELHQNEQERNAKAGS